MACPKSAMQQHHSLDSSGENEMVQQWFLGVTWLQTSFVLAWFWLKSAKLTFGQQQCQEDMACPKLSMQSFHSMISSLNGPIWRK
jgi:membrane-anchored glycerophosphoryl diester phosphodiesterase (GDPDase)